VAKLIDLTGRRFGKLTVIERAPNNRHKQALWICRCDCGSEHAVVGQALTKGAVRSCKCSWRVAGSNNRRWKGYGEVPGRYWTSVERAARLRGLPVEITIEFAWQLFLAQERRCALSGVAIQFSRIARTTVAEATASLDRIDSNRGYTPGNVQWIHKALQRLKNNLSEQEFLSWCSLVVAHHERRKVRAA
jgi:hypothetical protein